MLKHHFSSSLARMGNCPIHVNYDSPTKKRLKSHYWDDQFGAIRVFVVSSWEKLYEYLADLPALPLPDL